MRDISIIIASCNEYPMLFMTVFGLIEEVKDLDWEIIIVDNLSGPEDDARNMFDASVVPPEFKDRIKYLYYKEKQSHWLTKNEGIKVATGKLLFFPDAHIIMSRGGLRDMIDWMNKHNGNVGGLHPTMYIPSYLTWGRMEWKITAENFNHKVTGAKPRIVPEEIQTASTCCMLCRKEVFDELGMWNENFGVYFGGESYMVWKHITCGYPHFAHHSAYFWHPALRRQRYSVPTGDTWYNRMISAYCIGGEKWLDQQAAVAEASKLDLPPDITTGISISDWKKEILEKCKPDRDFIASKQVITIDQHFSNNGVVINV